MFQKCHNSFRCFGLFYKKYFLPIALCGKRCYTVLNSKSGRFLHKTVSFSLAETIPVCYYVMSGVSMKKNLKLILIAVSSTLAVIFAVTAVVFFIPRDNTSFSFECFRLRWAVSGFLKDVISEDYEDAFDRVYCTAEDGFPADSGEDLRKIWVSRVSSLRSGTDNTYIEDYSGLKVRKENGTFTVTVTLKVIRQGMNDPFYAKGSVLTVVYDDGWKISSVSEYTPDLQTPLEKALSGRFSAEESAD